MRYYFNTPDQINGDEAYDQADFTKALTYYKNAHQTLNQKAAERHFKRRSDFLYALAFVICEEIITNCEVINATINEQSTNEQTTFDCAPIEKLWQDIPGLVNELETVFDEMGSSEKKEIIKEKMVFGYQLLADVCEIISDELVDNLNEIPPESDLAPALEWITKALNYAKQGNSPLDLDLHLGYLNLLEKGYKSSLDKSYLVKISQHISSNKLLELPLTTMQTLEILSYQLLVAVANDDAHTANQYIAEFRELIANSADIDSDHPLIEDIKNLIAQLPDDNEVTPLRKRKFKVIDKPLNEKEEKEVFSEDEDEDESLVLKRSTSKKTYKKSRAICIDDNDATESVEISAIDTEAESIVPLPTAEVQQSYPKDLPSMSQMSNTATFFANRHTAARKVTFKEDSHAIAFVKTLKELGGNESNPNFLANILSLIADFYCHTKLPLKNTSLLAFELYKNALLLNPKHVVAHTAVRELGKQPIIRDNNRYGSSSNSTQTNINTIFIDAIESLMTQIEAFKFQDLEKINHITDESIKFIVNNLVSKNIAGSRSAEIASKINSRYNYFAEHTTGQERMFSYS
ncbi:Uncharacterised protein [Legionella beliardensis]|uniref:Uncharacterized protein n=1 Tax=Legionella beliardensis TaxID=91822 RepID=A0A378I8W7_9GAMM|nr:hypothetical protein [Legionella beliardensis]STX28814.1 Uncharacterised protein [Legionella beliardensis]